MLKALPNAAACARRKYPPKRLLHAPVLMARCERGSFGSLRSRCLSYVARRGGEGLSLFPHKDRGVAPVRGSGVTCNQERLATNP